MSVSIKTQNKKGENPKFKSNLGYASIFLNGLSNNMIIVDSYEGQGETYQERKEALITIQIEGKLLFEGTFKNLKKILEK